MNSFGRVTSTRLFGSVVNGFGDNSKDSITLYVHKHAGSDIISPRVLGASSREWRSPGIVAESKGVEVGVRMGVDGIETVVRNRN